MAKNYLTYPCKTMRITQSYTGTTSHLPHTTGSPSDYPWDEGCADTARDYCYCPCNEMIVKRIYGVGNSGSNTIWLESTSEVYFADGTKDFFTMLITHPNDDDLKKIKEGQKFKRGEKICREGTDGASGNHFHFSAGKGKLKGNGWVKNSKGKWVLTTTGGTFKPEKLFYVDRSFTKPVNMKGIVFKDMPKEETSTVKNESKPATTTTSKKGYATGDYKVTKANLLRVRSGAGTLYPYKKFAKLTSVAQIKIKRLNNNKPADGYVKGLTFTVTKVSGKWGQTASGWVCLDYCSKI